MLFILMYFSSFFYILSCKDWILVWLGLEINMISFIMMIYNKYMMLNIESCIKYFFIQSIGSILLLLLFYMNMDVFLGVMSMVFCYKIGAGPFYFWMPSVCENISWWSCYFLMTLQKIIPFMMISLYMSLMLWYISMISLLVGMLGSMNQSLMKHLMIYSSIHHIGWMLISLFIMNKFWFMYLIMYSLMILGWINFLQYMNYNSMEELMELKNKWMMFLVLMNLGGIPPLMGFFLKWWSFYYFMNLEYMMILVLIIFSVMMLYIYFRIMYNVLLGMIVMVGWKMNDVKIMFIQFDMLIIMSFILGSFMGMYLI